MGRQTLIELRAGTPLRVAGITLVPLERVRVSVGCEGRRIFANAAMGAEGVVVVDARGARALDPHGEPLDLQDLATRVRGLEERLPRTPRRDAARKPDLPPK